jgi:hypothetical protein
VFSLKNLFTSKSSDPQVDHELVKHHLRPIKALEIGSDRNGEVFLAVYAGSDDRNYVLTLPRGARPEAARLSIIGSEEPIPLAINELSRIARSLKNIASQTPGCENELALQCLNAFESAN